MVTITLAIAMVTGANAVCNCLFDSAYMVCGLTKFKMFYMHTDGAARNSIHCVHIFPAILKNNDASQRVKVPGFSK